LLLLYALLKECWQPWWWALGFFKRSAFCTRLHYLLAAPLLLPLKRLFRSVLLKITLLLLLMGLMMVVCVHYSRQHLLADTWIELHIGV
jgi:hypothetical protein